jgi:hypothetical protein
VLDTLAIVPNPWLPLRGESGGDAYSVHPFHFLLSPQLTADGAALVTIGNVRAGASPSFDLLRIGISGDTLLRRAIPYQPRAITPAERGRILAEFGDFMTSGPNDLAATRERRRQAAMDQLPVSATYPPVRQIVAGHDGSIWLLREPRPDGIDSWEVYGADGLLEGRVEVAEGRYSVFRLLGQRMHVLRATRDELWGSTKDALEVPYLHRFQVRRPCAS